jgi:mRNA interferase RelE/StbE
VTEGRYALQFRPSAARQLGKLPQDLQRRVRTVTEALRGNPRPRGAIKLAGTQAWRVRINEYRVIYTIADDVLIVTVVEIGHRREIYRR